MPVALDIETYRNYFLIVCKDDKGKVFTITLHNDQLSASHGNDARKSLRGVLRKNKIITFNGSNYDLPMIGAFLKGYTNKRLKMLSDDIIKSGDPWWRLSRKYTDIRIPKTDHIDLMGVTPLQASLKTYGCRIHAPTIQDLPIHPDATISDEQATILLEYCLNDVDTTLQIYNHQIDQIKLRQSMAHYGDMRSKSDPQIAEAIIRQHLLEAGFDADRREKPVKPFKYQMPKFIQFNDPGLLHLKQTIANATFKVDANGYVRLPDELNQVFNYAGANYKLGIGGLHSQEKKQVVIPKAHQQYGEFDVSSYYPSIILGQALYPTHLDPAFVDIYRSIFDQRIAAKHNGNKVLADTFKIVLNSSYGKFGSRYSFLYSPELLIQTTLTGQLALLMLIEDMTETGGQVKSANTDGINVLFDKAISEQIHQTAHWWSEKTTYQLEWVPYLAQYSRDVNSYVVIKDDGVKSKGAYELDGIHKGYANLVCIKAAIAYLKDGKPLKDSILKDKDPKDFLTMRGVRGGAVWRHQPLGKVVRWYQSKTGEAIRYMKNGNKVAGSDGATPMMVLSDTLPDDIDYRYYLDTTIKLLKNAGVDYE